MGRALYQPISYKPLPRHPSPRSPAHPLASPGSPKHFLSTLKSPSYLSPRSPRPLSPKHPNYVSPTPISPRHTNYVPPPLSPKHPNYVSPTPISPRHTNYVPPPLSPKHPNYLSPPPEAQVFVDAQNKDLPFDGGCKMPSHFTFEPCLGLKEQGELLMNFLTGVLGSPMEKLIPKMPHLESSNVVVTDEHRAQCPKNFLDINRRRFEKKHLSSIHPILKDMAVDTLDLDELTGDHDSDDASTDYDREEAQQRLDMEMEEHDGKKTITLEDYLEMVKKSMGRIGLQAQLLQELSLGEDVDMGVPDSELPTLLPQEKMGTEFKPGESQLSQDQETKAIPIYKGAMRATSLVIKRLRRMAGLMHTEQQSTDLKDVYDWLQHLGYLVTSSGKVSSSTLGSSAGHSVPGEKIDWRLPSSPAQALQMAQADLRDRLAYLYEEQNQIKNSKEQLEAAKRLVGKRVSKKEVKKLSKYLHNLKSLEEGYEELGGRIVQNLDDVKSLETKFKTLNDKEKADQEVGRKTGKKESKQDRKKDKNAGPRGKGSPPVSRDEEAVEEGTEKSTKITRKEKTRVEEKESKDSSVVSDSDQSGEQSDSQSGNEGLKRKRSTIEKARTDGATSRKASIQETDNSEGISSGRKLDEDAKRVGMGRNIQREGVKERASIPASIKPQDQDYGFSGRGRMKGEEESGSIRDDKGKVAESGRGFGTTDVEKLTIHSQHVPTSDKAIQTDNSELLLLMESMIDAMNDEAPEGTETPATKLKRLLKENKRMQVQLRFWRSRNWFESTAGAKLSRSGSQSASSATGFRLPPSIMMDSSSEDDFSIYFNPIRPPSILSQGEPSVGSSGDEDHLYEQAMGRPKIPSIIFGQEGNNRSNMTSGAKAGRKFNKVLQQNLPSIPAASSPNRSNTDILLETLQEMQPRRLESSNAMPSRSRNPEGIQTSPSEPMNTKLKFKSPQRFQPRSSNRGNTHPVPPILLEPLNAAFLTKNKQGMMTQSHPQGLSARLPSNQLQPIPAEVLNAALKAKAPSLSRQLAPRTIPSLNFGSAERFPPGKSLSAASRTAKMSKSSPESLHPLLSEPSTSQTVDTELSPVDDTLLHSSLPVTQPIEHEAQAVASPRNARNVSRNLSPRTPRPLVSSQQIQDGQESSGSPPRSPRKVVSPRRSHPPANSKGPIVANGLMIVGRSSTTQ